LITNILIRIVFIFIFIFDNLIKIKFLFFVRLECLIASGDETCEAGDLDLIQHMNVDMLKLTRLLNGKIIDHLILFTQIFFSIIEEVQKWRLLKKIHHTELVKSVEKVKIIINLRKKEIHKIIL
jgi:hypothetical protein